MTSEKRFARWAIPAVVFIFLVGFLLAMTSCGGGESQSTTASEEGTKLPPGTSEESLTETAGSGNLVLTEGQETAGTETKDEGTTQNSQTSQSKTTPEAFADLAGARFTVISASRPNSNADVIAAGQREVPGDYLEVELTVENVGGDIADLSQYSFRLSSPGIAAEQYEEYYGIIGAYGKYVSENVISAVLLDYTTLQPAAYKLKMGEKLDSVFLFFDLNPKSTARNNGVAKEGTNLVIYKQRGEDAGEEVQISLAGYPD